MKRYELVLEVKRNTKLIGFYVPRIFSHAFRTVERLCVRRDDGCLVYERVGIDCREIRVWRGKDWLFIPIPRREARHMAIDYGTPIKVVFELVGDTVARITVEPLRETQG